LRVFGSLYTELFGYCPFLFGTLAAGDAVKLIGAVEMSRTVYNALSNVFGYSGVSLIPSSDARTRIQSKKQKDDATRVEKLDSNINLLRELKNLCLQTVASKLTCKKAKLIETLQEVFNSYCGIIKESMQRANEVEDPVTVTEQNWDIVLLHMCYQMCKYNKVIIDPKTHNLTDNRSKNLMLFAEVYLPQAINRSEIKQEWFRSFLGMSGDGVQNKIFVTADFHTNSAQSTSKSFGKVSSKAELEQLAMRTSAMLQTSMQFGLELVQNEIEKLPLEQAKAIQIENILLTTTSKNNNNQEQQQQPMQPQMAPQQQPMAPHYDQNAAVAPQDPNSQYPSIYPTSSSPQQIYYPVQDNMQQHQQPQQPQPQFQQQQQQQKQHEPVLNYPFRQFHITELNRCNRTIVERVFVSIPVDFPFAEPNEVYSASKFIVKTFMNYNSNFTAERDQLFNCTVYYNQHSTVVRRLPILYALNSKTHSLVMEDVGTSCENHNFSIAELIQACQCVQQLHNTFNRVHNDLKERNFTMRQSINNKNLNDIFLIDFEGVSITGDDSGFYTKGYRAPERILTRLTYYKSDVYSLGIIFAKQVCGISFIQLNIKLLILFCCSGCVILTFLPMMILKT